MSHNNCAIGVTGGIGSGKSVVCKVFSTLGVPVYDADLQARLLMENDPELRQRIIKVFGQESYVNDLLNREWIAEEVFNNKKKLEKLNSLVHPAVRSDFNSWREKFKDNKYVIKEAALLIESGSYKELDSLILVVAPKELRIQRVLERDRQRNARQVKLIMQNQLPDRDKEKLSDYIIHNDNSNMIVPTILDLNKHFNQIQ